MEGVLDKEETLNLARLLEETKLMTGYSLLDRVKHQEPWFENFNRETREGYISHTTMYNYFKGV